MSMMMNLVNNKFIKILLAFLLVQLYKATMQLFLLMGKLVQEKHTQCKVLDITYMMIKEE